MAPDADATAGAPQGWHDLKAVLAEEPVARLLAAYLGRLRIGAPRLWPLSPELHTSDYSFACPGSSTSVDKVTSRDTPSLNLADCRGGVAPDNPQVALRRAASTTLALS